MLVSLTLIVERVFWAPTKSFNPHGIGEIPGWSRVSPLRWHPTLWRRRNWYAKMVRVDQRMHLWRTLSAVRETGILDGWNGTKVVSTNQFWITTVILTSKETQTTWWWVVCTSCRPQREKAGLCMLAYVVRTSYNKDWTFVEPYKQDRPLHGR